MAAMKNSSSNRPAPLTPEEKRGITAAEFAWDLSLQVAALRDLRGISQADLATLLSTKQQAISRLEDPGYARHSLRSLREFASVLNAYVDVILVPQENLERYQARRYQPVLQSEYANATGPIVTGSVVLGQATTNYGTPGRAANDPSWVVLHQAAHQFDSEPLSAHSAVATISVDVKTEVREWEPEAA